MGLHFSWHNFFLTVATAAFFTITDFLSLITTSLVLLLHYEYTQYDIICLRYHHLIIMLLCNGAAHLVPFSILSAAPLSSISSKTK